LHVRASKFIRVAACWALAAQLAGLPIASAGGDTSSPVPGDRLAPKSVSDPVMKVMQAELARASSDLGKTDSPPYFMSYTVYDQNLVVLVGAHAVAHQCLFAAAQADVTMRVGSPALDNTHGQSRSSGMSSGIAARR
jgi:hypothetical protein